MPTEDEIEQLHETGRALAAATADAVTSLVQDGEPWMPVAKATVILALGQHPALLYSTVHEMVQLLGAVLPLDGESLRSTRSEASVVHPEAASRELLDTVARFDRQLRRAMDCVVFELRDEHDLVHVHLDALMPNREWTEEETDDVLHFGIALFSIVASFASGTLIQIVDGDLVEDFARLD